jgi:hypothetical protein
VSVSCDPCPRCDEPLEGETCRECGYEEALAVRNYLGQDADLGDEEDEEYEAFLAREGLADAGGSRLALIVGVLAVLGIVLAIAVGGRL